MVTRGRRGRGGRNHARRGGGGGGGERDQLPAAIPSLTSRTAREWGVGPKPVAQPPATVPSTNRTLTSPSRTSGKGARPKPSGTTAPRPPYSGPSSLHPTAPVELPLMVVAPVEQVAQKKKATFPLDPRPTISPTIAIMLGDLPTAGSRGGSRIISHLPLKPSPTCRASLLLVADSNYQRTWAKSTSGWWSKATWRHWDSLTFKESCTSRRLSTGGSIMTPDTPC